jgi:hypothetical protein
VRLACGSAGGHDVECVTVDESPGSVAPESEQQVRRIPVVARGDRLVGIIAMAGLAREADVDDDLQDTFEDISSERAFWNRPREYVPRGDRARTLAAARTQPTMRLMIRPGT